MRPRINLSAVTLLDVDATPRATPRPRVKRPAALPPFDASTAPEPLRINPAHVLDCKGPTGRGGSSFALPVHRPTVHVRPAVRSTGYTYLSPAACQRSPDAAPPSSRHLTVMTPAAAAYFKRRAAK